MKIEYSIGEISKLFKISTFTIRFYEKKGLLKPDVKEKNLYRYYNQTHLVRIKAIVFFKKMGFSIEDIAQLLGEPNQNKFQSILNNKSQEIDKKLIELEKLKNIIDPLKKRIQRSIEMNGKLRVTYFEENLMLAVFENDLYLNNPEAICIDMSKHFLFIKKEDFFRDKFVDSIRFAVEMTPELLFNLHHYNIPYRSYTIGKNYKTEYLLTHFITNYEEEPINDINKIKKWLKENKREAHNDIICRLIGAHRNRDFNNVYDIYELWVPLKSK